MASEKRSRQPPITKVGDSMVSTGMARSLQKVEYD
jgi:hypothetical protein